MNRPSALPLLRRGRLSGFRARPFGAGAWTLGAASQRTDLSLSLVLPGVSLCSPGDVRLAAAPPVPCLLPASLHGGAGQEGTAEVEAVVQALLGQLGAYDAASLRHSFRVARLACALGRALELPAGEMRLLRWGALLHDVGKRFVPRAVLNKPEPLTAEERVWVDLHAQEGGALLAAYAELPPVVAEIARHHHDAWHDVKTAGEGHLSAPHLVSIVTVADVYDALVSERPYKSAWSARAAVEELRRQAGRHLDPRPVVACIQMLEPEE